MSGFLASQGIVSVADTSLGYGTPQTPWFLQSLAEHYRTRAFVVEPDEIHRPPIDLSSYNRLDIYRAGSAHNAHSLASYLDRNWQLAAHLKNNDVPIWVVFSPMQLALLKHIRRKPKCIIYYCLEIGDAFYERALRQYGHHIDHVIYPEMNRAMLNLQLFKDPAAVKSSVLYNATKRGPDFQLPAKQKRILYSGSISWRYTFAKDFLGVLKSLPIDIYGPVDAGEYDQIGPGYERLRSGKGDGAVYKGYLAGDAMRALLPSYAYTIVRWDPRMGLNYYHACPNKFFEGVAHGVPPIVAPHPQCAELLRKYECGLIAEDFSGEAMKKAIQRGLELFGTPHYDRMVERCLDAYDKFLNWDTQFARFAESLPTKESLL